MSRGRRMSRRHVVMRPRAPVSVKTSTTRLKPSPGSAPSSGTRSRSRTTARVTPGGTIASKNSTAASRSAFGDSSAAQRRAVGCRDCGLDRLQERLDRQIFGAWAGGRLASVEQGRAEDKQKQQEEAVQNNSS